ncbi:dehydrogenase [Leptolyngbya sp. BL0902]|uniref:NAD(P)/FAD-dependent oxidoreductase n=1 Tax=Leptolyngbya sp. BL0902 TaxID=1115757 RepID=UPI0018E89BF3|nr:NAD(P)/FAD-dependent oxidoreductase [Leptolyngbya sp. BL0902]QQE66869.1 dehydrogenase [Leptolyngbya sp. BL0902]
MTPMPTEDIPLQASTSATEMAPEETFDVVIVGAGPAGGQCGRVLAQQGYRVLLIERFRDFYRNNFSSGGTPLETLRRFDLPETVVGSWWRQLEIVTSQKHGRWTSTQTQGAVLDFARLRQFLADEVTRLGGTVWMGCRYVSHHETDGGVVITLKDNLGQRQRVVQAQVLVDATGPARAVMEPGQLGKKDANLLTGTGIEYLIRVDDDTYQRCAESLVFLLGHRWIPRGYSWVFPMGDGQLKVGAGVVNRAHQVVATVEPLKYYVELLIRDYLQPSHYEVLDVHGETLRYRLGLRDRYADGRVIAIGDTVSTVNFLGGEGIRHAMVSAEIAQRFIVERLKGTRTDFSGYRDAMHRQFLAPWTISERLALKKYLADSDRLVDKVVTYLAPFSLEEVVAILFDYRFEKISKGLGAYLRRRVRSVLRWPYRWVRRWFSRPSSPTPAPGNPPEG